MPQHPYYQNKHAFITGGSSGIGLAIAKELARMGAHVHIAARRFDQLQNALIDIEACRVDVHQQFSCVAVDVTDSDQVSSKLLDFTQKFGTPDVLVNSAGITLPGQFENLKIINFHEQMDVNYFGTVHVTKAFIQEMIHRRSGHIINISSAAGFLGTYGYTAYSASKFAVRGFSDTLRAEMRLHNICVSIVYPADVDTPQLAGETPYKPEVTKILSATAKVVSPEYVAKKVLNGAAKHKYVITPGFEASLFFKLSNLLGRGTYQVMDWMIDDAFRQIKKKNNKK